MVYFEVDMNVLTRRQFREHFNSLDRRLGRSDSPLWEPERHYNVNMRWFTCVRPIRHNAEYYIWVRKYCAGTILCFSSGDNEEWYGFTHHADIMFWLLRWG